MFWHQLGTKGQGALLSPSWPLADNKLGFNFHFCSTPSTPYICSLKVSLASAQQAALKLSGREAESNSNPMIICRCLGNTTTDLSHCTKFSSFAWYSSSNEHVWPTLHTKNTRPCVPGSAFRTPAQAGQLIRHEHIDDD